jgi:uncharacterized protein (TIGR00290 family)
LNFISREYKRCCFHGIEARLLKEQADCLEIPLVQREVGPDMAEYEREFKAAVLDLKKSGIAGMVFGDIYLDEHKQWVERVCRDLDVELVEPLWHVPARDVVDDFINCGFRAVVVSAKADLFGSETVGRLIDREWADELVRRCICPCGENGEFHTFVLDGPLFKRRIEIRECRPVLREGFWKHWFLDIRRWQVVPKDGE